MTACKPKIVSVRGIAPGVRGLAVLRITGFRAHCECGFLGHRRDNWFNARRDCDAHKTGRDVVPKAESA